jgi:2-keto-4-pentenoate hydratase/2-oxohepta-3-ene-1,7-dioic acid hydratase in catechol pathway
VIGNDLTARLFQDPSRAGGQFTRAKAFDNFAPAGPFLANKKLFGGLEGKKVRTTVNGKVMQDSALDLIHGPAKLVSFLSIGTSPDAVCLTNTFFSPPKTIR